MNIQQSLCNFYLDSLSYNHISQVPSGNSEDLRPDSPTPWTSDEKPIQRISIKLTTKLDEPVYVDFLEFNELTNVVKVEIKLIKTSGATPETITDINVCYSKLYTYNEWFIEIYGMYKVIYV